MPRTLAQVIQPSIRALTRDKGEVYFLEGRVFQAASTATRFDAQVRGTRRYDVHLAIADRRLTVACTCPFFIDRREPCKHIWAAALAADADGTLEVPVGVRFGRADADEEAGEDPDGLDERPPARPLGKARNPQPPFAPWQRFLASVAPQPDAPLPVPALVTGELIYVFNPARSRRTDGVLIELMVRVRKKSGEWGQPRPVGLSRADIASLPDDRDRDILYAVAGANSPYGYSAGFVPGQSPGAPLPGVVLLNPTLELDLLPRLCATGRLLLQDADGPTAARLAATQDRSETLSPIAWDATPTAFVLRITGEPGGGYRVDGEFRRDTGTLPLSAAAFVGSRVVLWPNDNDDHAAATPVFTPLDVGGAERWLHQLVHEGPVVVPASARETLISTLALADLSHVECPPSLRLPHREGKPRPSVRITRFDDGRYGRYAGRPDRVDVTLTFVYGDAAESAVADAWDRQPVVMSAGTHGDGHIVWRRDAEAERAAIDRLQTLGVRRLTDWGTQRQRLDLAVSQLPALVRTLIAEGWRVEAEGRLYRPAVTTNLEVRSGIDWFELHGDVDFGGVRATLPALLAAVKRGAEFVQLDDGTLGLLPEEWIARQERIASLGVADSDFVRFETSQVALLDAWLETQPQVSVDETFARARAEVAHFEGITPLDPPLTFTGTLRPYQRDALGWFAFLRRFGFGGCLADEMGLGKTVMVLALLEQRRLERQMAGEPDQPSVIPSVIVVPRSLVFNWRQEAERFTPALRVLDLTRADRQAAMSQIHEHDVVLTTYGTLRRDVGDLKGIVFDYVILDEAQMAKNARTTTAKAARLLRGAHRLALSGTPVENRLSELWSLFEFLNPGMLGALSAFAPATGRRQPDDDALHLVARGVRPFILRRTKEQVAPELPPRTEQTLYCDLEPAQRHLYDDLRDHYRASLLGRIDQVGLAKTKMHVLEALLRLRQAACHPGLLDPARVDDPSAKLDLLMPRLQELVDDGRQAIVFSQFTSLLALLRRRLDEAAITYEYLDGQTRDREERVARFQSAASPLFLVSLKAGGVGLNLTAAEHVFLLDPWWNPAVEAQAIDRTHRIGQTKPVFAFRLIARDTIEEKVLQLQASKRALADAIVRADEGLLRDLRREDLELLLS